MERLTIAIKWRLDARDAPHANAPSRRIIERLVEAPRVSVSTPRKYFRRRSRIQPVPRRPPRILPRRDDLKMFRINA